MKTGIELIAEERQRQIEQEGWTAKHDDEHVNQQLPILAMLYACPSKYRPMLSPTKWFAVMKWALVWWRPTERIKELQKAGALIAAEIDRLQRIENAIVWPSAKEEIERLEHLIDEDQKEVYP